MHSHRNFRTSACPNHIEAGEGSTRPLCIQVLQLLSPLLFAWAPQRQWHGGSHKAKNRRMSAVLVKQFLNSDCGIHFKSVGEARNLWKNQKNQIINFEANKHSRSLWEKQKKQIFQPQNQKTNKKQWENQKN